MLDEVFIDIFDLFSKLVDFTEHGVDIATAEDGSGLSRNTTKRLRISGAFFVGLTDVRHDEVEKK